MAGLVPRRARVGIAEDHAVVREGLRLLIDHEHDMTVVFEASDGCEAVRLAAAHHPDVLVTDLSMPRCGGLEVLSKISETAPNTAVVILTAHEEQAYLRRALNAGAQGYVLKRSTSAELIRAMRQVLAGKPYVDPALAAQAFVATRRRHCSSSASELTNRERQVVILIAKGFGNSEVAEQLGISVKTVETHKYRIMAKMQFASRVELVRYALAQGLLAND